MATLKPDFRIVRHNDKRELHYTLAGFWKLEDVELLREDLLGAATPFISNKKAFSLLGDLRDAQVQSRDVAERIRILHEGAEKFGAERTAIVTSSMLVKLQFQRLVEGIELECFDNKSDALAWLRQTV